MVSKPSFDIHESPTDLEGRHAAILNRDCRLTVSVGGVYEAGIARHAFTLTVLDRAPDAKLEVERQSAPQMAIAKQVQTRLFLQRQPQTRTPVYAGICQPAALRASARRSIEQPDRLPRPVNQLLYENTADGDCATLFFAEYDDRTCKLRYSNCGHPSTLLLRGDDAVEGLGPTCKVVGLFDKRDCTMEERELAASDAVLLYTDGVTEALNGEGEEFGEERLLEAARQNYQLSLRELLIAVVDRARRFSPREGAGDITAFPRSRAARSERSGAWG